MKDKKLWIDLTMLVHWQGQLTGIQRVEFNLARRFSQSPNVSFCVFDKHYKEFFEYDFANIEAKITALQNTQQTANYTGNTGPSLRHRLSPYLPSSAKRSIKAVYNTTKFKPKSKLANSVKINSGEKLLILSGDWSDEIFYTTLTAMKQKTDFSIIQIVYDLLPAVQPAFFVPGMSAQVSNYMAAILSIANQILAISQATKKDIQNFQKANKLSPCPVDVFRLGDDFANQSPLQPQIPVEPNQFLLCVGTVESRKNHQALYYAVREAIKRKIDLPPIVIAGKKGWLVDNLLYLVENDPTISQKIIFLHDATDREIAWLFKNCMFTLYPSFYEGWGLPIAESLFYNKFCLSSGTSSMPEIAGDLVDYFSPNNPAEILGMIHKYTADAKLLKSKEEKIKKNYKPTSWDDTFAQVGKFIS